MFFNFVATQFLDNTAPSIVPSVASSLKKVKDGIEEFLEQIKEKKVEIPAPVPLNFASLSDFTLLDTLGEISLRI